MGRCGITETGSAGEKADGQFHEILQVIDTEDQEKEGRISQVYSPGIFYMGKLQKKAKVSVYKYRKEE